ncbi:hypothetical protein [Acidocella sp.]|uniref:hypothetical protein n=1 Tax=Acidocella sp. TaxID=50710 RepID=UPI0026154351|nr:hypothetical protein [Acidocella sp.]
MKNSARFRSGLGAVAALALIAVALSGCVYYPSHGYAARGGYYAPAPVIVAPPVVVGGWWGWGDDDD